MALSRVGLLLWGGLLAAPALEPDLDVIELPPALGKGELVDKGETLVFFFFFSIARRVFSSLTRSIAAVICDCVLSSK